MASFYYFYQKPSGFCFFVQIKGFCYLNLTRLTKFKHSRLPITRTLVNSNRTRFPLNFFHTYTVILPSVTRALDNSNLPLTRSFFFLPFKWPLHNFTLDLKRLTSLSKKGKSCALQSEILNLIFYNNCVFFVFTFWSVQFDYSWTSVFVIPSVHDTCILSPFHFLVFSFSVTCFELPITPPFLDFPSSFELPGVDCVDCLSNNNTSSYKKRFPLARVNDLFKQEEEVIT